MLKRILPPAGSFIFRCTLPPVLYYFYAMKNVFLAAMLPLALLSCKAKEKKEDKKFISVLSLIRKQVAHIDTSLYSIMKLVYIDSNRTDTTYIPREQFADAARDFLDIPDLADPKVAARFKEEPMIMDQTIGRVIITYTPVDPGREECKSQQLLATPVIGEETRVNNIIITREVSNRDSFLHRQMLWQMDRSFQVTTVSQKVGKPETTTTFKVTWNEEN